MVMRRCEMMKAFKRLMGKGYKSGANLAHDLLHHYRPAEDRNDKAEAERATMIRVAGIAKARNAYRIDNPRAARA